MDRAALGDLCQAPLLSFVELASDLNIARDLVDVAGGQERAPSRRH